MGKRVVRRYKIPELMLMFLILVSLEWIVFTLFLSLESDSLSTSEMNYSNVTGKSRDNGINYSQMKRKSRDSGINYNQMNLESRASGIDYRKVTRKFRASDMDLMKEKRGSHFKKGTDSSFKSMSKQQKISQDTTRTAVNYTNVRNCTNKVVRLSKIRLPVTGLVGFPGTGSTWLRHLVQQMTGIGTASVYCDGVLKDEGFPFECIRTKQQATILTKTHEEKHFKLFTKIVLLVRNPYEALLAYFSWVKGGHTGRPSKHVLLEASKRMFNWSVWWYVDLTNGTLTRFNGPIHLVQYEKLKTNMAQELWKLSKFLQVNVTEHDIACTVKLQEGGFHRKINNNERLELLRTVFNTEMLQRLKNASDMTEKLIRDYMNLTIDVGGAMEDTLLDKK